MGKALDKLAELAVDERSRGDSFDPSVAIGKGVVAVAKSTARYIAFKVLPEMFAAVTDRLIPQGANELGNALFTGHAYSRQANRLHPIQPTPEPTQAGYGVHGPEETPEERAAKALEYEEAKAAQKTGRMIEKEVESMSPTEQKIARSILNERSTTMPEKWGPSLDDVWNSGLEDLQNAVLGLDPQQDMTPEPPTPQPDVTTPQVEMDRD